MFLEGGRDSLATLEAALDEVASVLPVHCRTGRATGFPTIAAGLEDYPVRTIGAVEHGDAFFGVVVDGDACALQTHRVPAPTARLPLGEEGDDLVGFDPADDGLDDLGRWTHA